MLLGLYRDFARKDESPPRWERLRPSCIEKRFKVRNEVGQVGAKTTQCRDDFRCYTKDAVGRMNDFKGGGTIDSVTKVSN